MKQAVTLVVFMLVVFLLPGQNWQWVRTAGGGTVMPDLGHEGVYAIVTSDGSIICNGTYSGNFSFGDTIAAIGQGKFWCAYDQYGNRDALCFASKSANQTIGISGLFPDAEGNFYTGGNIWGGLVTIDTVLTPGEGFWTKFNSNTRAIWSKNINAVPGGRTAGVMSMDFDESGNIYMTGLIDGIDNYIDTTVLHNAEGAFHFKYFVAAFDSTGASKWIRQCYGGNTNIGRCFWRKGKLLTSIGVSDTCSVYGSLALCPASYPGNSVGSIMALDPASGQVIWHTEQSGYGGFGGYSYADHNGNTYYAGVFDSIVFFDTITITREGLKNGYIVKYDTVGSVIWAQQYYSSQLLGIYDMYTDPAGNTCIAGSYKGDLYWNGNVFHNNGYETMFVTRYNTDGKYLGTVVVTDAVARGVTQDASGNIIITGHTSGASATTMFGDLPVESSGNQRFFVGKLDNITGLSFKTEEDEKLKIYANPNNGQFTIQLPEGTVHEKKLELRISSMAGADVYKGKVQLNGNLVQIDLGVIEKGTYSVSLQSTYKRYIGLVVVQ